jgi:hydrogenase maturation protease
MTELRILGIGSPFGDDQLGWAIVNALQQRTSLHHFTPNQLQMSCCDRPGMHLLKLMSNTKSVFLIDAVKSGAPIGTLHCVMNKDIEGIDNALSTHGLGIAEAMKMGAALNELPERVVLYGVEINDPQLQFHLSEQIITAIAALVMRIENDIFLTLASPQHL